MMGYCGLDSCGLGNRTVAGSYQHGNKSSGSIKCRKFLDKLRNYQLLKKDSVPEVGRNRSIILYQIL
jgi:hypothetical protein